MQLIECVPNFSEGLDKRIINQIADAIKSVDGVYLLNVDPGKNANRTVITFVGSPEAVVEGGYRGIMKAGELIDMTRQHGEHPRIGATDVCPLIPVSNITIEEVARHAQTLAKRVGEAGIPVFLYEASQPDKSRNNLAVIRSGEYEGMFAKIKQPEWQPDFGPAEMDAKRGATVIGARDFLIAYNVNLDTSSVPIANQIAAEVRESGRATGKDEHGNKIIKPGSLKSVKAIGWYMEEYGKAQVSMNLTNFNVTPLHIAFDEVSKQAERHGVKVTGSELIGLIPLKAIVDAGRFFAGNREIESKLSELELIDIAVKAMGLNELAPFDPKKRIIEYVLSFAIKG